MPARPSRRRWSQIPSGMRNNPPKNGAGIVRNARMPTYGFSVSPRSVIGRRNSQKTVAVVTMITPARLIQLFERWTKGESQPRPLGAEELEVMRSGLSVRPFYITPSQERGVEGIDVGVDD